jgi:integrase
METDMNFRTQAAAFMHQIQTRRRNPIKRATIAAYQSRLTSHILPALGDIPLDAIDNSELKRFVAYLLGLGLSDSVINGLVSLTKIVISSAVDSNGNEMFPRKWNNHFIDLPTVNPGSQKAPTVAPEAISGAISRASGQDKALYALLAGTGLRIGEALALMVGPDDGKNSFWQPETGTLTIRTTVVDNQIQMSPKTEAGVRQVDLAPELNSYLCKLLLDGELPGYGLVFTSALGGSTRIMTAYEHLKKVGIPGFHSFRRFRITHLDGSGAPRGLVKFWAGHAASDVTERYIRSGEGLSERKAWAQKAGLGFQLEAA